MTELSRMMVKDVPAPPRYPMTKEIMFTEVNGKKVPDMKVVRQYLMAEGTIEKNCLTYLLSQVT